MKIGDRVSVDKVGAKLNPNLLKAALIDEADTFMILDKHKKDVRDLNRRCV